MDQRPLSDKERAALKADDDPRPGIRFISLARARQRHRQRDVELAYLLGRLDATIAMLGKEPKP